MEIEDPAKPHVNCYQPWKVGRDGFTGSSRDKRVKFIVVPVGIDSVRTLDRIFILNAMYHPPHATIYVPKLHFHRKQDDPRDAELSIPTLRNASPMQLYVPLPPSSLQNPQQHSKTLGQPQLSKILQIARIVRTLKVAVPRLTWQNPRLHARLPAPLRRLLRLPRPVEPAPASLEADHLRDGELVQPLLVRVAVAAGVRVCAGAAAGGRFQRAVRREDGGRGVARVEGTLPAGAHADVVDVLGAVGVGLGPLAAHGGTEARRRRHAAEGLLGPGFAGEVELVGVVELELVEVEDDVLVDVEEHVVVLLERRAFPVVEPAEAVAEDEDGFNPVFADLLDGLFRPGYDVVGVEVDHARLVDEAVHGDDVLVAVLSEEDGEFVVDVEPTVTVQLTVCAVEPTDDALSARMVPSVLAARSTVQVEIDAQAVLTCVFDATEEVTPGYLTNKLITVVCFNHPVAKGDSDVVEASSADVNESLAGNEGGIMFLKGIFRF